MEAPHFLAIASAINLRLENGKSNFIVLMSP